MEPVLKKQVSNIITSTHSYESTVLDCSLEKIWNYVKDLALDKLIPSKVKSIKYFTGQPGLLGSLVKIFFMDQAEWDVRIVELSELRHSIAWEVIATEPIHPVSSVVSCIKLKRVTDGKQTFISWVGLNIIFL